MKNCGDIDGSSRGRAGAGSTTPCDFSSPYILRSNWKKKHHGPKHATNWGWYWAFCPHPLGSLLLYEITARLAFLVCACYQAIRSAGRVSGCLKLGASDETAGFSEPESHWRILPKDPACLSSTQACGVHAAKWSFLFGAVWLTDTWRRVSLP